MQSDRRNVDGVPITTGHIIWAETEKVDALQPPRGGPVGMHAVAIFDGTPAQRTIYDRFAVAVDYMFNWDFFDQAFIFASLPCRECKIRLNVSPSD